MSDIATARIRKIAKAGHSLDRDEVREAHRVAEVSKAVCRQSCTRLVTQSAGRPLLQSCSGDGTPIQISTQCQQSLPNGRVIKRAGKCAHEFLIAFCFIRCIQLSGLAETRACLNDPIPLTRGKAAWQQSSASRKVFSTLRQLGHRGGAVQHYAWDRCGFGKLRRIALMFHSLLRDSWSEDLVQNERLWRLEWIVFTACALHDCQNMLKWALKCSFDNTELIRKVYIGTAAVRNSMDIILAYMGEWLREAVVASAPLGLEQKRCLAALWTFLDVDDDVIPMLVDTLELRCSSGKLYIRADSVHDGDLITILSAVLLAIWKVRKFSDSRWLGIGRSSRCLIASRLSGMKSLLEFAAAKPSVSGYYVNGFFKMADDEEWLFIVQAAVVATVPEAIQASLLADSRVAKTAPKLRQEICEKMQAIVELPLFVWEVLAGLASTNGPTLRSSCIAASHRAIAFFQFRVLEEAEGPLWSLCRGDIVENLKALAARDRPSCEGTLSKIWDLVSMGWPMGELKTMVETLGDSPWTSATTEQLHASAAVLSRFHPEYSLCTLLSRSMALAAARLLPSATKDEKQVESCRTRLKRLLRSCPEKTTGRHLYFGDLCKAASSRYGPQGHDLKKIRKRLMKTHGKRFSGHPAAIRDGYAARARAQAQQQRGKLLRRQEAAEGELRAARVKVEEASRHRGGLLLSSSSWGSWELELFEKLYNSDEFSGATLHHLRDRACEAPPDFSAGLVAAMEEEELPKEESLPELPTWLKKVANYRERFQESIFVWGEGENRQACKFLFAMQQPFVIYICRVQVGDVPIDVRDHIAFSLKPRHAFSCDFLDNHRSDLMHEVAVEQISVIHGCQYAWEGGLTSAAALVPLAGLLEGLPSNPGRGASSGSSGSAAASKKEPLEPWAQKLVDTRHFKQAGSFNKTAPIEDSDDDDELDDLDDELVQSPDVKALLQKFRDHWRESEEQRCSDFQTTLLGGAWTSKHKGVLADAFSAQAKGERAIAFCIARHMPRSARYEISLYTEQFASVLARAWCHRMQFLLNLAIKHDSDTHAFSPDELASWVEPTELARAEKELQHVPRAATRIAKIRALH